MLRGCILMQHAHFNGVRGCVLISHARFEWCMSVYSDATRSLESHAEKRGEGGRREGRRGREERGEEKEEEEEELQRMCAREG